MTQLTLASGSQIRATLLRQAGVEFSVQPAKVDELAILGALRAEGAKPLDISDTLAEYKARQVANSTAGIVLGCDQVLVLNGEVFSKPESRAEAADHLRQLRGQGHQLLSSVVTYEDHEPVWRFTGRAQLVMREFSDAFLENYLDENCPDILNCVGCYMLEGAGAQLFSKVQGDYFSILGLPLIEVLDFLRSRGIVAQ